MWIASKYHIKVALFDVFYVIYISRLRRFNLLFGQFISTKPFFMHRDNIFNIRSIIILLLISSIFWNIIGLIVPILAIALLSVALTFMSNTIKRKTFGLFLAFFVICLFDVLSDNIYFYQSEFTFYKDNLLFCSCIFVWSYLCLNRTHWETVSKMALIPIICCILLTFTFCFFLPDFLTLRNTEIENWRFNDSVLSKLQLEYTQAHAIPCLIPIFVCLYKHSSSILKYLSLIMAIIIELVLLKCSITTSSLLGLLVLCISLLLNDNRKRNIIIISLFCILAYLLRALFVPFILFLGDTVGNDLFMNQMNGLAEVVNNDVGVKNNFAYRQELYQQSWDVFFHNIFGVWDNSFLGGHCTVADYLAYFGILPFILWAGYIISIFKENLSYISNRLSHFYVVSLIPFFGLCFSKGTAVTYSPPMLFLLSIVIPGLLIIISEKSNDKYY